MRDEALFVRCLFGVNFGVDFGVNVCTGLRLLAFSFSSALASTVGVGCGTGCRLYWLRCWLRCLPMLFDDVDGDGDDEEESIPFDVRDGRGLCLLILQLLGGLGYKINSSNTGIFSYPKSPNDSFSVNLLQWCENRSRRIL